MRFFYSKLNKFCFATVDKKLKDFSTTAPKCSTDDFRRWINDAKQTKEQKNIQTNTMDLGNSKIKSHHLQLVCYHKFSASTVERRDTDTRQRQNGLVLIFSAGNQLAKVGKNSKMRKTNRKLNFQLL